MNETIDTIQEVIVRSTTPAKLDALLDELFPGVTERVSQEDKRAIVLTSTLLALDATTSRIVDKHMQKVQKAWTLPEDES